MTEPDTRGERLAKRVAALRGCSRAEAERLVEGGWVQVDGVVVEDPAHRVQDQTVQVDPQARPDLLLPVTLLWHKPAGLDLAEGQPVDGLLQAGPPLRRWHLRQLRGVAALPPACSGLAVFGQEPRVLRRLLEDAALLEQEWMLDVAGHCDDERLRALESQAERLSLGQARPSLRLSRSSAKDGRTRLRLAMKAGNAAALPGWLASAGLEALLLQRMRLGRVALGPLASGEWRLLGAHERF